MSRPAIVGLILCLAVLLAVAAGVLHTADQGTSGASLPAAPEEPPPEQLLRERFDSDHAAYVTQRDRALALASPSLTLQSDYFDWGDRQSRSEMQSGRWWAEDESWLDTAAVLEQVGLDATTFKDLKAFLRRNTLLALQKIRGSEGQPGEIVFLPREGRGNSRLERVIVWHADLQPRSKETRRWVAEHRTYPQHMRETALPTSGWFIRETTVDRPR